jgi:hypothetical protein
MLDAIEHSGEGSWQLPIGPSPFRLVIFPRSSSPPLPALRADLSPPGRGEGRFTPSGPREVMP